MEKATFAAGCFWGVEATFGKVAGVAATRVGYTGGDTAQPTYEQVCTDRTGHAEALEVTYDPERVSYEELLDVFFAAHDPTQWMRQGPDYGSQYRSAIFTHSETQAKAARAAKERLDRRFKRPVVTQIAEAAEFWEAEDYHQQYYAKRGIDGCVI